MKIPHTNPALNIFGVHNNSLTDAEVAVLGVPFDMGYHPTRIGSRGGPDHIRMNSMLVAEASRYSGLDPISASNLVDLGNVEVTPSQIDESYRNIEAAMSELFARGVVPVTMGGDGAVTLPQLRAVHKAFGQVTVLHFDAHTDAYPRTKPQLYNNANCFVHAAKEGLVDVSASIHAGIRDTSGGDDKGVMQDAIDIGYRVLTMDYFAQVGIEAFIKDLRSSLDGKNVYLCWDMDVFDPSVAPGVVTPSWGGFTTREGLQILRGLSGLNFVSFDINTVSPPHDRAGQTGSLASHVILEFLKLKMACPSPRNVSKTG